MSTQSPKQKPPNPVSVYWLPPASHDGEDVERWITIPASRRDFWSFPITRLVHSSWSEPDTLVLEFLTHTFKLKPIKAEELGRKVLSGQTSMLTPENLQVPDWFEPIPMDKCEAIMGLENIDTNPAYELLKKNT